MTDAPVRPGDLLAGKYRVERVLGVGGMGVVVLATHTQLDQAVALKFLLANAAANAEVAGRFLREARLAVKLRSEHVAKVLDVGTLETGSPYIVMEYLHGEDLNQLLERGGPLPVADVAEYVIQACDGIAEAHALGIVHRDLKPANLFLTRRPDGAPLVKVLDFGVSKTTQLDEAGHALTRTATVLGSPFYMSPEQMKSSKDVDARSDVWSLGVIVYQLLTARLPFEAETLGGLMATVLTETHAPVAAHRADAPAAMQELVARCLQKDRSLRTANVAEVALALAPFAPSRAQPIAERVAALLRVVPSRSTPAPALAVSQVTALSTSQAVEKKKGAPVAALAVAGVVIVGILGLGARQMLASPRPGARSPALAPPTESVSVAPAPPAPPPEPPPTITPATAVPTADATATVSATARVAAAPTSARRPAGSGPSARATSTPAPAPPPTAKKNVLDDRN